MQLVHQSLDVGFVPTTSAKLKEEFSELGKETQEIAFNLMAQAENRHGLFHSLCNDIDFQESINYQSLNEFYQVVEVVMLYFINEEQKVYA
ncbi:MAG: hypothetical protein HUJ13_01020 [Hydrogenovibrio crunogenus]|nr:hypothetical protein [Hydrogenovibrio crunogenus]